ncbi:RsmE family RNA methyltransferase, partial [Xanthomonas translucens]
PLALADAAAAVAGAQRKLTLDPQGEQRLRTLEIAGNAATIAIGPEGGWSPRDRAALHAAGFAGLRLGPRILRTETAGLAAIAALQARCGDL